MTLRRLVPLVSGLVVGLLVGLWAKDMSTNPDLGEGWGFMFLLASLFVLALILGGVGLVMLIPRRTRAAGIGVLIGVIAWGGGYWSGVEFGPAHPPRVATMQVVIDGPSPRTWEGSADCVRPDPDGGGLGVSWVSAPDGSVPWTIGDQPVAVSVIYGRPSLDRPSVEISGDDGGHGYHEPFYTSDEIDAEDVWQTWDDTEVQGDDLTGRTSGTVTFENLHSTGPTVVGGVPIPDEISGRISWTCSV
jgi:hypothetical protein